MKWMCFFFNEINFAIWAKKTIMSTTLLNIIMPYSKKTSARSTYNLLKNVVYVKPSFPHSLTDKHDAFARICITVSNNTTRIIVANGHTTHETNRFCSWRYTFYWITYFTVKSVVTMWYAMTESRGNVECENESPDSQILRYESLRKVVAFPCIDHN